VALAWAWQPKSIRRVTTTTPRISSPSVIQIATRTDPSPQELALGEAEIVADHDHQRSDRESSEEAEEEGDPR
jgi:hypothetical protein